MSGKTYVDENGYRRFRDVARESHSRDCWIFCAVPAKGSPGYGAQVGRGEEGRWEDLQGE